MINATTGEGFARPEQSVAVEAQRLHYMDNVRALAMILGIVFHAALAYSPLMHNLWFTSDANNHVAVDAVAWFTHLFRMPVFFVIAGFFALMLLEKRGIAGMLKHRALRILLPLAIFLPLTWTSLAVMFGWAMEAVENPSPMLGVIKFMSQVPDAPPPPVSTVHLWFLFNLMLFVVAAAAFHKLGLFQARWFEKVLHPKVVLIGLPILMVPAFVSLPAPHPAPEKLLPELWSFGSYGLLFLLGTGLWVKQDLLEKMDRYRHTLLTLSLVLYVGFFYAIPGELSMEQAMQTAQNGVPFSWTHLHVALAEAYIAVFMSVYCLLMGKRLLNRENRLLRLMSDSSYWLYIIHLPLLLVIQFVLLDVEANMWLKFALSTVSTLGIGLISYFLLVRWTPIGWMLNGRRQ